MRLWFCQAAVTSSVHLKYSADHRTSPRSTRIQFNAGIPFECHVFDVFINEMNVPSSKRWPSNFQMKMTEFVYVKVKSILRHRLKLKRLHAK